MSYDDRDERRPRRDDNPPPRRPRGPDSGGGPRSGGNSRPEYYGADRPSRPRGPDDRSSNTPSRARRPDERASNTPSRPRGPDDRAGNTPPRARASGDYSGGPPPRSGGMARSQGGARDAVRRVRDAASSMYEAMSREVRSISSRRDGADRRSAGGSRSSAQPSRSRRDDYGYDRDAPVAARGYDDGGYDDEPVSPRASRASGDRALRPSGDRALTTTSATRTVGHPRHSLVRRLRDRRAKLSGEKRGTSLSKTGQAMLIVGLLVIVAGGGMLSGYSYFLYQKNAQTIQLLAINRNAQTTRIYDRNGQLLYQIYGDTTGRHDYITYCQIPEVVMHATVDTEDASFWSNPGFDAYHEIVAAFKDVTSHSIQSGASTITEQLVKNAVLNDNRQNIGRKFDEALLAVDLTQQYTKQQILTMYLNEVSYGPLDYGIEAAAQNYFNLKPITISLDDYHNHKLPADQAAFVDHLYGTDGCHPSDSQKTVVMSAAWQLQYWQAELLAGVPQNPNNQGPYNHPQASVERMHDGVLRNMITNGDSSYLTLNGQQASEDDIIKTAWNYICINDPTTDATIPLPPCPNDASDPKNKTPTVRQIHDSVQIGNGSSSTELAPYFVDYVLNQLDATLPRDDYATKGWNIYTTLDYGDPTLTDTQLQHVSINYKGDLAWNVPADNPDVKGIDIKRVGLQQYAEYITRRNITQKYPDYWYCGLSWSSPDVAPYISGSQNPFGNKDACLEAPLNAPLNTYGGLGKDANDAALVAIDPRNGDILAMVGGVDYNSQLSVKSGGQNNLATANRSMGSSTKPLVYATAFQMGWNPGTIVRDQPTCFPNQSPASAAQDPKNDEYICPGYYLPHNYSPGEWAGAAPIRMELGNSLNTPAELALSFDGLSSSSPFLTMAQRLGVESLSASRFGPSTALGGQEIPLYQLTSAYGTFANNGVRVPERSILQITDALGNQVKDTAGHDFYPYVANPPGYQAISAEAAYQVTSVLTDNDARTGDFGKYNPLHFPGRDVAAKTGTSQNVEDIVTMGYTPSLSLGVWVGNADQNNTPLAQNIIGIAGAAYIFNAVMAFAIDHYNMPGTAPSYGAPIKAGGSFPIPPDMKRVQLSCYTGLAPYSGQDATDSFSAQGCDISKEYVPPQMTGELNGAGGKWRCYGWGCNDSHDGISMPGIDTAWIPANQIPVTP